MTTPEQSVEKPGQYAGRGAVVTELRYAEDVREGWRLLWDFDDPNPAVAKGTCEACGSAKDGFAAVVYGGIPGTVRVEETVLVADARTYPGFGVVSLLLVRDDGRQVGAQVYLFHLLRVVGSP